MLLTKQNTKMEKTIINPKYLKEAFSYSEYRKMIDDLLAEGKSTGLKQSEYLTEYSKLNVHRMKRLDKNVVLKDELVQKLKSINQKQTWLIITEGWCGDSAQSLPALEKMANVNPLIETKYLLRDDNQELMEQYLTNGAQSIPKVILINTESLEELANWGPRPKAVLDLIAKWKKDNPAIAKEEWTEKMHKWYADDKTESLQNEFLNLL